MAKICIYCQAIPYFGEYLCEYLRGRYWDDDGESPDGRRRRFPSELSDGVVVGCYCNNDFRMQRIIDFAGKTQRCVVMFTGSDLLIMKRLSPDVRRRFMVGTGKAVFCVDGGESNRLEAEGIIGKKVYTINLPPKMVFQPRPLYAHGFEVGCYVNPNRPDFYGLPKMMQIAGKTLEAIPNSVFRVYHSIGYPRCCNAPSNVVFHTVAIPDMDAFLSRLSCSLRFTRHDTYSMTAIEAMMAGRYVISNNGDMPKVTYLLDADAVVRELVRINSIRLADRAWYYKDGSEYYHINHSPAQFVKRIYELLDLSNG